MDKILSGVYFEGTVKRKNAVSSKQRSAGLWRIMSGIIASYLLINTACAIDTDKSSNTNKPAQEEERLEVIFDRTDNLPGYGYTLDVRENSGIDYPHRWNPFSKGMCSGKSLSRLAGLTVLSNGNRIPVSYSYDFFDKRYVYLTTSSSYVMYFQAGCDGLIWGATPDNHAACVSVESNTYTMLKFNSAMDPTPRECNKFKYIPIRERSCSGVLESEITYLSDYETNMWNMRIFKPSSRLRYALRRRKVSSPVLNFVLDGDVFDFSSKNKSIVDQVRNPRTGLFLTAFDTPEKYEESMSREEGFRCYESPMVYYGNATLGYMGEVSHKPCDKQKGCMWFSLSSDLFSPRKGDILPEDVLYLLIREQPLVFSQLSGYKIIAEVRNDGPIVLGGSGDPHWHLERGSRIRIGDYCLTSTAEAKSIRFELCNMAEAGRYYVPVSVLFPDPDRLTRKTSKYRSLTSPCVDVGDDGEISAITSTETSSMGEICATPYGSYQLAQSKHGDTNSSNAKK
ncbi:hypothetical protein [Candidatus Ichthyocystis hellenicum]|uniref:hypothetical protein n=1 Tax=Candidatus Ichthyocystis hellenicum TaxID=1561003 RepID=UPI000B84D66C|nr:hypothetical protein [Candidatus Ichthyocystis hellenicum]